MSREKPFPNIIAKQNKTVMDVHLNNYDTVFVKPIADKVDAIKPLYYSVDGKDYEVEKIVVSDPARAKYDEAHKVLTLNLDVTGVAAFTDLTGVPSRFPTEAEMATGHDPEAKKTTMFLVAREDGIYFENHVTGIEVDPRKSTTRSKSELRLVALERRIAELESKLELE